MNYFKDNWILKNKRNIVLVSFSDQKYNKSQERLISQTIHFPFTELIVLTEKDLPKDILKIIHPKRYPRGYGYWLWKPYVIYEIFKRLNKNDILVWSDVGNYWSEKGLSRFNEYLDMASDHSSGLVVFDECFLEKDYTKSDLLDYYNVLGDVDICMSNQIWSGCMILRNNSNTLDVLKQWWDIHLNHFDLTTDKASIIPNSIGFVEHRHDQSTWSIICKIHPHISIPWFETQKLFYSEWDDDCIYPIQARRLKDKERTLFSKLLRSLSKPYKYLKKLYLIKFEHFYFSNSRVY